jgi:uncharacterized repeat protein (TIGR03803 family)
MRSLKIFIGFVLAMLAITVLSTLPASAQTERVVYSFNNNGVDGYAPTATLISDSSGNFYGTTQSGGAYGYGTVFEVRPQPDGGVERILHSFNNNGVDGYSPNAGLVQDSLGNLYGATPSGGTNGDGVVFELVKSSGWHEKVIYNFGYDGSTYGGPESALIFDSAGNLYGATNGGGTYEYGTVFELKPIAGHGWASKVLYSFNGNAGDGAFPIGGLTFDSAGNLYGTTVLGGAFNEGTVFELSPASHGNWTETLLYSFGTGTDGQRPLASVILDPAGNIYGVTNGGGTAWGTVFELSSAGGSGWTETLLYTFISGGDPVYAPLVRDSLGNLYGTASDGGDTTFGAVFELSPVSGGGWNYTVLHSFDNNGDGYAPFGGLVREASGILYGTTLYGGAYGGGTVFAVRP